VWGVRVLGGAGGADRPGGGARVPGTQRGGGARPRRVLDRRGVRRLPRRAPGDGAGVSVGEVAMRRVLVALGLSAAVLCAAPGLSAAEKGWKAGVAVQVITPTEPMWMSGYAARNKPAEGKLQDLYVKALALEDPSGGRLVL